jgi:thiol-disulfide isomerase/thioredoxin
MSERINKTIELCANVGITLATLLISYTLIRGYLFRPAPTSEAQPATARRGSSPGPTPSQGAKVTIPGVDFANSERTLLFVLSSSCKFCKESAPFYQRIVQEAQSIKDLRLVAVLPQDEKDGEKYLSDMGISIREVKQSRPESVGTSGFPTLILVDNKGAVKKAWVGKLPAQKEAEVVNRIKCATCG